MTEALNLHLATNMLLAALCAASCVYCALLSGRLKRLNDMKSGVGASILSLTKAIEQTHLAARRSKTDVQDALADLQSLIDDAEAAIGRLEAKKMELSSTMAKAERTSDMLEDVVHKQAPMAIRKTLKTTESLLKVVTDISRMNRMLTQKTAASTEAISREPAATSAEPADQTRKGSGRKEAA